MSTRQSSDSNGSPQEHSRGLDVEHILQRLNGDRELLQDLVKIYVEDSPALLERIRRAIETHNAALLVQAAHALKGLASNFSTNGVERSAQEMEVLGKQQAWETVPDVLRQIETEMDALGSTLASDSWR